MDFLSSGVKGLKMNCPNVLGGEGDPSPISFLFFIDTAEIRFFCRAVTLISSQRLLHKNAEFKGSSGSSYSRSLNVKTQPRNSNTFVECICRNISFAPGKWSLHSRWNFISTFTDLHVHGDERWPTEVTSNTYFRGVFLIRFGSVFTFQ